MVMMQTNSKWQNKATVKKGNIGERLVNEYLIGKGFIPYSPDVEGAHPFDRLVASKDKKTVFIADAKTKARRKFYPDTGIDIKHYNEYKFIQDKYGIDVFIFFVDEEQCKIYGNFLRALDVEKEIFDNGRLLEYPLVQGSQRYFPLVNMKDVAEIPKEESEKMKQYTTKKIEYQKS